MFCGDRFCGWLVGGLDRGERDRFDAEGERHNPLPQGHSHTEKTKKKGELAGEKLASERGEGKRRGLRGDWRIYVSVGC